jgi:hypothetical protein
MMVSGIQVSQRAKIGSGIITAKKEISERSELSRRACAGFHPSDNSRASASFLHG